MYTRPEIERILKVGFEYAMKRNKHLTVVDKANVLASSRLWRQIAQEMAPQYPEVTTDYMFVDNAAMKMIQEPKFFDVMVTENTFGDILTDEGMTGAASFTKPAMIVALDANGEVVSETNLPEQIEHGTVGNGCTMEFVCQILSSFIVTVADADGLRAFV